MLCFSRFNIKAFDYFQETMMSDLKEFVNDKLNENEKTRRADYEALDKKGDKQFDEMKTLLQEAQNQNIKQIDYLQVRLIFQFVIVLILVLF